MGGANSKKSKTTRSKNIHTDNVSAIPINEGKKYSTYYSCLVTGSSDEEARRAKLIIGGWPKRVHPYGFGPKNRFTAF